MSSIRGGWFGNRPAAFKLGAVALAAIGTVAVLVVIGVTALSAVTARAADLDRFNADIRRSL
jgi:hypothetical protein